MSNQNAFQQNGVQMPIFASVSQANNMSKFGDDIDLSDIFAEYLNDGDDPLTTFSNFSNYSMGLNQQQQQQQQQPQLQPQQQQQQQAMFNTILTSQDTSSQIGGTGNANMGTTVLPTGRGIKTAFHAGILPTMQSMPPQQQQQQQTFQQQPPAKKLKLEDTHMSSLSQHTGKAVVPSNVSTAGSGITGRLGLNVFGGQISLPQKPPQSQLSAHGNVQLPIGVGIRVGGVTPQSSTAAAGGVPLNHMQWNSSGNKTNAQFGTWAGLSGSAPGAQQGISEQAMAERRQRNREHAKRSRVRKKFLLESLQADVSQLQSDNNGLRMLIQSKIPQHAQQIIDTCCMKSPLFGDDGQTGEDGKSKSDTELSKSDYTLIGNLTSGQQNFVLSDPRLPDNPIVFASEGFYQLTGYTREQVLGRNCRFLQGPGTDPKAVDVIRTAVANGTDASTCILNYKADGTPFWNQFFVAALRDSDNCIVNYVGVQCVVDPDAGASALEDKVDSVLPLQEKGKGEEK